MGMNLKREGAAIRALLDKADGLELSAEASLEKARMDADEMRWEAARRCTEAFEASGLGRQEFNRTMGIDGRYVSNMLRAWQKWGGELARPSFNEALAMLVDDTVAERAARGGRSILTQSLNERKTRQMLRDNEAARAVMRDPVVRDSARRAIVAAEAEEARQRLMADANPVDLPLPQNGFDWLDAEARINHARKLVHHVSRMVKEHGPLTGRDTEMLLDSIRDIRISLDLLESMVKTGDMDEALARLLEQEA